MPSVPTLDADISVEARPQDPSPPPKAPPMNPWARHVMRLLTEAKETIMLRLLSRNLSAEERRKIQAEVAKDPKVDKALRETLTARPQFRRKASGGGGIQGRPGR